MAPSTTTAVTTTTTTGNLISPEKKDWEFYMKVWKESLHKNISRKCFNMVQFTTEEDDEFGSDWQKMCFKSQNCCPSSRSTQKQLWELYAMKECKAALRVKKYNTTGAMRKRFNGEFGQEECTTTCIAAVLLTQGIKTSSTPTFFLSLSYLQSSTKTQKQETGASIPSRCSGASTP